ncbi:RNA polymerase sigma factor [Lewinella cohaerens]|uniref:RNA polymerase sigma factor n=1 Tax=Lewinella cohaerens TaxID=70995 RepID=UPI001FE08EBE|nr:sigma-70 family RNA polymerase sigma factor [Lewinella cohaerens]
MFSILQTSSVALRRDNTKTVNNRFMTEPQKTVSASAMEAEWLEIQAAQANPARFRPLYERYFEPIYRFVYRRTSNADLSADLSSQVFLKALQRLGGYEYRGVPFSAWLFRIASNEIAQHFRDSRNKRTVSVEDHTLGEVAEEMELDEDLWQVEDLIGALDQLKPSDVEIIELRFFEQRPFKEVAEILGITESNAKVKTYRILERLKKRLKTSQTK